MMAQTAKAVVRKILSLPPELVKRVDAYRRTQEPLLSEAEAMRRLLARGLETEARKAKRREPTTST